MTDIKQIIEELKNYDGPILNFMEVCGTHTAAISENGISGIVSDKIHLVSGPGCPVCVTVAAYIDKLLEFAMTPNTCVVTFGDMIRVRGSHRSLRDVTAEGGNVKMIYSPFEIIELAQNNPRVQYVFAAVGFETTTPIYAIIVEELISKRIDNVRLLTALKTMPAVIDKVCEDNGTIDGFIAPGHVSVITGSRIYESLAQKYQLPFVVAGFEGEELLAAIYALTKLRGRAIVKNLYLRAVTSDGNTLAQNKVLQYFEPCKAAWRGLGIIENSGMRLRPEYVQFDAGSAHLIEDYAVNKGCSCPDVITGRISPTQCPLYGKACTPDNPQGACMVSTEGSCYNYFVNRRG